IFPILPAGLEPATPCLAYHSRFPWPHNELWSGPYLRRFSLGAYGLYGSPTSIKVSSVLSCRPINLFRVPPIQRPPLCELLFSAQAPMFEGRCSIQLSYGSEGVNVRD